MSISASIDSGVCGAGLITLVQPAAMAGPSLRVPIAIGKFHGVISRHGPTGWRGDQEARAAGRRGLVPAVDPNGLFGEVAEKLRGIGDLAARLGQRFAHLQRHQQREVVDPLMQKLIRAGQDVGPLARRVAAKSGWAATAASSAALPSAGDASATEHRAIPVAGSATSKVRPVGCVDPFAVDEQSLLDSLDDPCLVLFAHTDPFVVRRPAGQIRYADC